MGRIAWIMLTLYISLAESNQPSQETQEAIKQQNQQLLKDLPDTVASLSAKLTALSPWKPSQNWKVGDMITFRLFPNQTLQQGISACKRRQSQLVSVEQIDDLRLTEDTDHLANTTKQYHVAIESTGFLTLQTNTKIRSYLAQKPSCRTFSVSTNNVLKFTTTACDEVHTTICARRSHSLQKSKEQITSVKLAAQIFQDHTQEQINIQIQNVVKQAAILSEWHDLENTLIKNTQFTACLQQTVKSLQAVNDEWPTQPMIEDFTNALETLTNNINFLTTYVTTFHVQRLYAIGYSQSVQLASLAPLLTHSSNQVESATIPNVAEEENDHSSQDSLVSQYDFLLGQINKFQELDNYLILLPQLSTIPAKVRELSATIKQHQADPHDITKLQKKTEDILQELDALQQSVQEKVIFPSMPDPSNSTSPDQAVLKWLLDQAKATTTTIKDIGSCSGCVQQYSLVILSNLVLAVMIILPMLALHWKTAKKLHMTRSYLQLRTKEPVVDQLADRVTKLELQQIKMGSKLTGIREDLQPLLS